MIAVGLDLMTMLRQASGLVNMRPGADIAALWVAMV